MRGMVFSPLRLGELDDGQENKENLPDQILIFVPRLKIFH
jgi:hypothetical protein